jgi:hypothetical protein
MIVIVPKTEGILTVVARYSGLIHPLGWLPCVLWLVVAWAQSWCLSYELQLRIYGTYSIGMTEPVTTTCEVEDH